METSKLILAYLALISLVTILLTVIDKINAKNGSRRIPEDFLLTLGLLGGSAAEFVTMKLIRHKTRHKKFMIGLPAIIIIQLIIIVSIFIYTQRG